MKPHKSLLFIALACLSANSFGQDEKAKALLDELSNKTRKYNSITSDFSFTLDDKQANVKQTQDGTLKMQGKHYYIKLGVNEIFSDGQTRWTYNKDMNEVYIDDAAAAGEDALNPSEIYTVWETGFKHYYEQEVNEGGVAYHVIKLIPLKPEKKSFHTVKLYVDKSKVEVSRILIMGKQGDNYTYQVKSFKTDNVYQPGTFVFTPAKYPGVEKIDNR
jgi:outer membrane lipoprotein-sorting protein